MTDTIIAITLLWIFVVIYSVAASFDFGAGFWSMIYLNREKTKATSIANRYLSPSWEVVNVFIVLIVVALVTFFPGATYTLGSVLLIPGSLVLLLMLIRSAFMVFSHLIHKYDKTLSIVSGITGILVPALLISVLPVTQGGFIQVTNGVEHLDWPLFFTSPHVYAYIGLAVSSTLFLSSLLLADYSYVAGAQQAFSVYRRDATLLGPITLLMAVLTVVTMNVEATWLYDRILAYLPWLIASVFFFFVGYIALLLPPHRRLMLHLPRVAVVAITIQYLLASYAYGAARLPYIVYPHVTIESSFTHPDTFHALFICYLVGFAILIPGFIYFWRLFMKDEQYVREK
ncbi:cytochrome d ubiquinol oxidase subunit II [Brevibacillus choshinensis]|uniref:cytochrome d ubiquinol oxidase subunit II n=1 Tax=Brevibacillus choshinensis TaxID=54911 RepID=UPI002E1E3613|nr:cytochrome d ubiquinol oxidase subunit II [Brevibacillus choshinensis]MED4586471.1 cytochrome d ubiquinol oxidase subunit II [Brevibacillus choshinensis]MED4782602.1 cytochrome d ubiquinol oxidase subunit II [Brevibacillus choshinensis]